MELRHPTALAVALMVSACGGDGPTDPNGGGSGNGGGGVLLDDPSFQANINPIFTGNGCTASNCHGGGKAGLTLTSNVSDNYGNLVNVPATSENFLRVKPGDAQNSYLVIKLEGRQTVGSQMPLTGCCLDPIVIGNIRN
ncbi:MAG TPA: hypothetical protein VM198_14605 [Longimicrobiales bacterium]|nr:hypothetical protein [Longimicrobiales bacterium]